MGPSGTGFPPGRSHPTQRKPGHSCRAQIQETSRFYLCLLGGNDCDPSAMSNITALGIVKKCPSVKVGPTFKREVSKRQAFWDEDIHWTVEEVVVWEDGHGDTSSSPPRTPPLFILLPVPLGDAAQSPNHGHPLTWNL